MRGMLRRLIMQARAASMQRLHRQGQDARRRLHLRTGAENCATRADADGQHVTLSVTRQPSAQPLMPQKIASKMTRAAKKPAQADAIRQHSVILHFWHTICVSIAKAGQAFSQTPSQGRFKV
jgi:hypothetical protein